MNQRWVWKCLVVCVPAMGCIDMERVPPRDSGSPMVEEDAGEDAGFDAGPDVGPIDAGPPTPNNTLMAIGITDNSGGAPQTASLVALKFRDGIAGPGTIVARRVGTPITLDGIASEWVGLPESIVPLQTRGGAIGMTQMEWEQEYTLLGGNVPLFDFGIPTVAVRAAYDNERIYFLLTWKDASENRERDTWFVDAGVFVRSRANEDRAYIGFDINKSSEAFQAVGCSGACHLRERLGDVSDAGRAYRTRMHTNAPGEALDYWNWRAGTTDPIGAADDGYIDETSRKFDGMADWITTNQVTIYPFAVDGGPDAGKVDAGPGVLVPAFMDESGVNANPIALFKSDAGNGKRLAIPFDPTGMLPTARIPGWLMQRASPMRDDVSASGRYSSGYWTVEFSRALTTTDPRDTQFPLK
jgi:hypothetical protein